MIIYDLNFMRNRNKKYEFRLTPEKKRLKPVLLHHSPFLLSNCFRREEKKGKK